MKTLVVKASGVPTKDDLIILGYTTPRGGFSAAKVRVRENEELPQVIERLVNAINAETGEWCPGSGDFRASARGTILYVQCSDLVTDAKFSAEVQGSQTLKFELKEMGGR